MTFPYKDMKIQKIILTLCKNYCLFSLVLNFTYNFSKLAVSVIMHVFFMFTTTPSKIPPLLRKYQYPKQDFSVEVIGGNTREKQEPSQ